LIATERRISTSSQPQQRPQSSVAPQSALAARLERIYIACVSFVLGVAGTIVGLVLGVAPYYRSGHSTADWIFVTCVAAGTLIGLIVGIANGPKWYRASESSPLAQKRMLSYLRSKDLDSRYASQRTLNRVSLQALIGTRKPAPR
jgi:hypothetical protein